MAVITAWFYGHLACVNVHLRVIGIILFKLKNMSIAIHDISIVTDNNIISYIDFVGESFYPGGSHLFLR